MSNTISASSQLHDISLRFCSNCLKKFCPTPEQIHAESVRFFVPTLDALFRNHFAYIELPKQIVDFIYQSTKHFSVDLSEIAEVLHIEIGELPSYEREEEIKSFYSHATEINFHLTSLINA